MFSCINCCVNRPSSQGRTENLCHLRTLNHHYHLFKILLIEHLCKRLTFDLLEPLTPHLSLWWPLSLWGVMSRDVSSHVFVMPSSVCESEVNIRLFNVSTNLSRHIPSQHWTPNCIKSWKGSHRSHGDVRLLVTGKEHWLGPLQSCQWHFSFTVNILKPSKQPT